MADDTFPINHHRDPNRRDPDETRIAIDRNSIIGDVQIPACLFGTNGILDESMSYGSSGQTQGVFVIADNADISSDAFLDESVAVWHLAQIRERVELGPRVIVGRGAYLGAGVIVGPDSKIQNHALIYEPASIGRGVFIGPGVILTNDRHPRAVNERMEQKSSSDWERVGVTILDGASIGAGAICVAPIKIGAWSMVAAGSVVIRDVLDHALVAGNPARMIGWVGRSGGRLIRDDGQWLCRSTGETYRENDVGGLELINGSEL